MFENMKIKIKKIIDEKELSKRKNLNVYSLNIRLKDKKQQIYEYSRSILKKIFYR